MSRDRSHPLSFLEELPGTYKLVQGKQQKIETDEATNEYLSLEVLFNDVEVIRDEITRNLPYATEAHSGLGLEIREVRERVESLYNKLMRALGKPVDLNSRFANLEFESDVQLDVVTVAQQVQRINERLDALELEVDHFIDKAQGGDLLLAKAMQEILTEPGEKRAKKAVVKTAAAPLMTDAEQRLAEENRRQSEVEERAKIVDERLRHILEAFNDQTNEWRRTLTAEEIRLLYSDTVTQKIQELRKFRDLKLDAPVFFDCRPEQIAWKKEEIRRDTKVYIGPLFKNCLRLFRDVERVFTSFPEDEFFQSTDMVGGSTKEELKVELQRKNINVGGYVNAIVDHVNFTTTERSELMNLGRLKVRQLGIQKDYPTTKEIFARIKWFGGELCPPEAGPYYRLQHNDQPNGEYWYLAMEPITDLDARPMVFWMFRNAVNGSWLYDSIARPEEWWNPWVSFIFRIPQ